MVPDTGAAKNHTEIGFVVSLSVTVFVIAYVALSYIAYLAAQSF